MAHPEQAEFFSGVRRHSPAAFNELLDDRLSKP